MQWRKTKLGADLSNGGQFQIRWPGNKANCLHNSLFTDAETDTQGGSETCPRAHD